MGTPVTLPLQPPRYINIFEPFQYLYGLWSTSGSDWGIAHFFTLQEYNRGSGRKKNKRTKRLGLTRVQKWSYVTLCMCRLTLLECRLIYPHCGWTSSHVDWSLSSGVDWSLSSPFAICQLLSPFFVSLSDWCPLTTSVHVEIAGPKPFVWFRVKTDKGIVCLADHLHSVTLRIPQSSRITEASPSCCFVSYPKYLLGRVLSLFSILRP